MISRTYNLGLRTPQCQLNFLRQRSRSVGVLHGDTLMLGDLTLQVNLSPVQSNSTRRHPCAANRPTAFCVGSEDVDLINIPAIMSSLAPTYSGPEHLFSAIRPSASHQGHSYTSFGHSLLSYRLLAFCRLTVNGPTPPSTPSLRKADPRSSATRGFPANAAAFRRPTRSDQMAVPVPSSWNYLVATCRPKSCSRRLRNPFGYYALRQQAFWMLIQTGDAHHSRIPEQSFG